MNLHQPTTRHCPAWAEPLAVVVFVGLLLLGTIALAYFTA